MRAVAPERKRDREEGGEREKDGEKKMERRKERERETKKEKEERNREGEGRKEEREREKERQRACVPHVISTSHKFRPRSIYVALSVVPCASRPIYPYPPPTTRRSRFISCNILFHFISFRFISFYTARSGRARYDARMRAVSDVFSFPRVFFSGVFIRRFADGRTERRRRYGSDGVRRRGVLGFIPS